jgi:hypothetical protein
MTSIKSLHFTLKLNKKNYMISIFENSNEAESKVFIMNYET